MGLMDAEGGPGPDALGGEIRQPVGIDDGADGLGLPVTKDAHGWPLQRFPRIEIVPIPQPTTATATTRCP